MSDATNFVHAGRPYKYVTLPKAQNATTVKYGMVLYSLFFRIQCCRNVGPMYCIAKVSGSDGCSGVEHQTSPQDVVK